jgi:hypothetical protein
MVEADIPNSQDPLRFSVIDPVAAISVRSTIVRYVDPDGALQTATFFGEAINGDSPRNYCHVEIDSSYRLLRLHRLVTAKGKKGNFVLLFDDGDGTIERPICAIDGEALPDPIVFDYAGGSLSVARSALRDVLFPMIGD